MSTEKIDGTVNLGGQNLFLNNVYDNNRPNKTPLSPITIVDWLEMVAKI